MHTSLPMQLSGQEYPGLAYTDAEVENSAEGHLVELQVASCKTQQMSWASLLQVLQLARTLCQQHPADRQGHPQIVQSHSVERKS